MLIINHQTVEKILSGRELELIDLVGRTYDRHDDGQTVLPHSTFLRFPNDNRNRIIGLPAYLGGPTPRAGIKWIASFPGNIAAGQQRASAAIILNSMATGQPEALIEGSLISARRTAASAALGARMLSVPGSGTGIALIGCGVINFEILRFTAAALPELKQVTVFDPDPERAAAFARRIDGELSGLSLAVTTTQDAQTALAAHLLISIATNSSTPHLDLTSADPVTTVLHVSLRDLTAETILAVDNVVDDADHVCREQTSLHLAEQLRGNRGFIHASIGALVAGTASLPAGRPRPVVFSPFGLGVLDLAFADLVATQAERDGLGIAVDDFLPA